MNPLIAALVAIVVNGVAALVALRASAEESRAVALGGAVVTLGAAALCAFPLLLEGAEVSMLKTNFLFKNYFIFTICISQK